MNELIQELVGDTADIMPGVYTIVYESGKKGVEFQEDALEKFVELIVKECMMLCQTAVSNADYNTGRMHCLNNIKEHFGVEE